MILIKAKTVQIPYELFIELCSYIITVGQANYPPERFDHLESQVITKLDSMVKREIYTKYQLANSDEEREQLRKEYLKKSGME